MSVLIVIENPQRWPLRVEGAEVVPARKYLSEPFYSDLRRARVVNMCRSYAYQSVGYYVSLLAQARGHRAMPSVETLQDLKLSPILRLASADLDGLIQSSLRPLKAKRFELSIYFGRNLTSRYDRLCHAIFEQFHTPFLRASFEHDGDWSLTGLRMIAASEIPDEHREFVMERASAYFAKSQRRTRRRREYRYDLAILVGPEAEPPSDEGAISAFSRAAREQEMDVTLIGRDDYARIAEFDALFIRETTAVNHHTYRFARRAAACGLVVIDDPESIVRCTNKVYQAELFGRKSILSPPTMVVQRDSADLVAQRIGLPAILKQPDSSFSRGVVKVDTEEELHAQLDRLLETSELVIAQSYVVSQFDWRIGVLDGRPLYVCKYYLAPGDWRIINTEAAGRKRYGKVETLPIDQAPPAVMDLALRSCNAIGSGLYGVDIKVVDGRAMVVEVNDNPTIESGSEDRIVGRALYDSVMAYFRTRLDARGSGRGR